MKNLSILYEKMEDENDQIKQENKSLHHQIDILKNQLHETKNALKQSKQWLFEYQSLQHKKENEYRLAIKNLKKEL